METWSGRQPEEWLRPDHSAFAWTLQALGKVDRLPTVWAELSGLEACTRKAFCRIRSFDGTREHRSREHMWDILHSDRPNGPIGKGSFCQLSEVQLCSLDPRCFLDQVKCRPKGCKKIIITIGHRHRGLDWRHAKKFFENNDKARHEKSDD